MIIKKLINLFINKNKLCFYPNQHAPRPSMEIINDTIKVNGYQEYMISKNNITPSKSSYDLDKKTDLLKKYYQSDFIKDKTFLDLGAASGYFTFMAILNGSKYATAIDIDSSHLKIINDITKKYNYPICFDYPIGHGNDNHPIIVGANVIIESGEKYCKIIYKK